MKIQLLLYSTFIRLLSPAIALLSFKDPKAKKWVKGRKDWKSKISQLAAQLKGNPLWIHVASLGEYQMARPLIKKFLDTYPERSVVVSFFSPSGYENVDLPENCFKFYLPPDVTSYNTFLIEKIKPAALVFVKYDLWFKLIDQAKKHHIPLVLLGFNISINKWNSWFYGGLVQASLKHFELVTVLDENKMNRFSKVGNQDKMVLGGDLRYRNVLSQSQLVKPQPILEEFSRNHSKIIVCGSIWPKDLEILAEEIRIRKDVGWIIAPHEIDNKSVSELLKNFEQPVDLYSDLLKSGEKSQSNIIILNTIGDLFHAYRYADIAYVGGAFGSGLHNILEPAAFGKAVLFGPEISKFPEASFFIHQRIGAKVTTQEELSKYIELFYQEKYFLKEKLIIQIMEDCADKTDFIYERIFELF